jgi:hypothetical protein
MSKYNIMLGDKVKDKVSGFVGIVVGRIEFINGCVQYLIAKKANKGELAGEKDVAIDSYSLEVIKKRAIDSKEYEEEDANKPYVIKKPTSSTRTGGPNRFIKRSGY